MEVFSDEQLQELARKHKTTFSQVRWLSMQLRALSYDVSSVSEEALPDVIAGERERGQYHVAAVLWFIAQAKQQGLGDYETADLFVALVDPREPEPHLPPADGGKQVPRPSRRAPRTHPDRDVFARPLVEDDWLAIRAAMNDPKMSRRAKALLAALCEQKNEPQCVWEFCHGYYQVVTQANGVLRHYGETGYYLKSVDDKPWNETSVQIWVRRSKA